MSDYADPNKANVWLDGDAFRFKKGTVLPEDVFAEDLGENFLPYGGIEAGFNMTSTQTTNKLKVWNYRSSSYKVTRDPLEEGVTFRAVDNSEATKLTRAMGGKITKIAGRDVLEKGDGEEFGLLIRLFDGDDSTAIWYPNGTVGAPTRTNADGQGIDGWEFTYEATEKPKEFLPEDSPATP